MNHNSSSNQQSNGNIVSYSEMAAFTNEDRSSVGCETGQPSTPPQTLVFTPTTITTSAMIGIPLLPSTIASGSSTTTAPTSSSNLGHVTPSSSSTVAATAAAITSSYNSSATSPFSTRYPAKIHYKLQNRSSPTNLSSGCPTTNNSPSTSSVSSPVTSEHQSPLLSPSAHSSNNGNCLCDINEEIDQAMQSSTSAALPTMRPCASFTPTIKAPEDIEIDDLSSGQQPVTTLETFPFSQITQATMTVTGTRADGGTRNAEVHNGPHFKKGSVIELGNKTMKRIEEITADDLMQFSGSNCLKFAKVDKIQMANGVGVAQKPSIEITLISNSSSLTTTASIEQPFISRDDGWVSASPQITTQLYGLPCQPIKIGSQLLIGFTTSAQYGHVGSAGSESGGGTTNGQYLSTSGGSSGTATTFHVNAVGSHSNGGAIGLSGCKLENSVTSGSRSAFTPLPSSPGRHSVARKRTLDFDSNNIGTSKSPNLQTPETKVS